MNRAEFNQTGGFPFETDTLDFLQKVHTTLQSMAAAICGATPCILSGCVVSGSSVSDGYVVINGELLPFKGATISANVGIIETISNKSFQDGSNKPVYYDRYATFTLTGATPWSSFVPAKSLIRLNGFTGTITDDYNVGGTDKTPSAKAVNDLFNRLAPASMDDAINNRIIVGSPPITLSSFFFNNGVKAGGQVRVTGRFSITGISYVNGVSILLVLDNNFKMKPGTKLTGVLMFNTTSLAFVESGSSVDSNGNIVLGLPAEFYASATTEIFIDITGLSNY